MKVIYAVFFFFFLNESSYIDCVGAGVWHRTGKIQSSLGQLCPCYLSLLFPLELLPVDPARVLFPLESPESFLDSVPTCSFELALLTVLLREGGRERGREREEGKRQKKQVIKQPDSAFLLKSKKTYF